MQNEQCEPRLWRAFAGLHPGSCIVNSSPGVATVFLALLAIAPIARAQVPAECAASECAAAGLQAHPAAARLWTEAAAIHQLKLGFVDALQRFTRAQAGTFGDEGDALLDSLASMTTAREQWDAAVRRFQADADRLPPSADLHTIVAAVLLDAQRANDALRELAAADRLDGARADVHMMRALVYGATGRPLDALSSLRAAAALAPDDPTIQYSLAQILAALNRSDEAADARRHLHRVLARSGAAGNPAAAGAPFQRIDLLRQSEGAAPIFPQGRYAAGFAALYDGRYADALALLTSAARSDPLLGSGTAPHRALVHAAQAFRRGEIAAAVQTLHATIAEAPSYAEPHRLLGLVYWVDGQHGRSIEQLRTAIRLAPDDERARVLMADVLLSEGRSSEAERELKEALDAGVRSGQIHYRLAELYLRLALLPQAVGELESSDQLGAVAGRDRLYQLLGTTRVDAADFDGAVAAYRRRIEVNPNFAEAHRQLGEIYFLQGRDDEALMEFSVAVWLDPADARAHAAAAHVHVRAMRYPEAAAAARRALALQPDHRQARYALGSALLRTGDVDAGRRELDLFEQMESAAAAADRRAFEVEALRREAFRAPADRAVTLMEQALAIGGADARAHRDLGAALLRAQRPQEAIPHLLAAQRAAETVDGFRYLADAFAAAGDSASAAGQISRYTQALADAKAARIRELGGVR
jgi:tetratricopeptide (TPR) repeat protein